MGEALLAWSASVSNFAQVQANHSLFGWQQDLVDIPCAWSGITCQGDGQTFYLGMRFLGLNASFDDSWDALGPWLLRVYLVRPLCRPAGGACMLRGCAVALHMLVARAEQQATGWGKARSRPVAWLSCWGAALWHCPSQGRWAVGGQAWTAGACATCFRWCSCPDAAACWQGPPMPTLSIA